MTIIVAVVGVFQSHETDDLAEVTAAAKELAARGSTVVIHDHGHHTPLVGASDNRQVAKYYPNRRVEHGT